MVDLISLDEAREQRYGAPADVFRGDGAAPEEPRGFPGVLLRVDTITGPNCGN